MRLEEILKTGALCASIIGMCVLGAAEPMAAALSAMFGGGALCAVCVKHGFLWGAGISVLGGIAALLFFSQIGPAAVSVSAVTFVAFAFAYCIRKNKNFKFTMVAGILTVAAVNGAVTLIGAYLTYGTVSLSVMVKPILDMMDAVYGPVLAGQEGAKGAMDNIKNILTGSYVGYSMVASIVSAYFTFLCGRFALAKIYGFNMEQYDSFDYFRVSMAGGIVFAASFILMLIVAHTILKLAFSNFVIMMSPIFLLGGLSVAKFYLVKFKIGPGRRAFAYIAIFATVFLPFFSLVNGMIAVGLIDSLVNYRKL